MGTGVADKVHETGVWPGPEHDSRSPTLVRSRIRVFRTPHGFAVEDIRATVGELLARGVKQMTEIEGGPESGQYWCYFQDPEGNVFEVAQQLQFPEVSRISMSAPFRHNADHGSTVSGNVPRSGESGSRLDGGANRSW
jgi:hypothetical protein